jgi:hypothetical protein
VFEVLVRATKQVESIESDHAVVLEDYHLILVGTMRNIPLGDQA